MTYSQRVDKPRLTVWLAIALSGVLLAGCGGGGDEKTAGPAPTATSTSPSSSAPAIPPPPPAYVENQTCRTNMAPVVDIMLASYSDDPLEYNVFDNRVDQLTKQIDGAVAACSPAVNNPARKAMYKFTLARLQWKVCSVGDCKDSTKNILSGLSLARKVEFALEATI